VFEKANKIISTAAKIAAPHTLRPFRPPRFSLSHSWQHVRLAKAEVVIRQIKNRIGESMRIADSLKCRWTLYLVAGIALVLSFCFPTHLHAQKGNNTVCTGTGTIPGWAACSASVLDASQFSGADVCAKIASAIASAPAVGTVIDARGIGSGTNQTCASVPWNGSGTAPNPAVILLPSGTITIPSTWVLPDYTRVFGEGQRGNPAASGTVIQAASGFTAGTPMIQFGALNTMGNCVAAPLFGISLQDVMLSGGSQNIVGILNKCAQETSYVERVNLYQIEGTGLSIVGSQAQNSGPYANMTCNPGSGWSATTACVEINGVGDLRGIHGFTATASAVSSGPTAAIYLDSNNSTIVDAHFEGFQNGILVGDNASANGNVIMNVTGGNGSGPVTNVVRIANAHSVTNLSLQSIASGGATYTIEDDEYSASTLSISDSYVATYVIGDLISSSPLIYSRFNTSKSTPAWLAGASSVSGSCATVANGTLYSNSGGGSGSTLYVCLSGTWSNIK
jgi:hypothetical protein